MGKKLEVVIGDITQLQVDAIVNAANSPLLDGGGVNGAIHRAAGPDLAAECRLVGGCKTGNAVATYAYRLPAKYIIHAIGPVWQEGKAHEDELLASCYRKSLEIATQLNVKSLAFPAISTGIYGYPKQRAAEIAVREIRAYTGGIERFIFACFEAETAEIYFGILRSEHLG